MRKSGEEKKCTMITFQTTELVCSVLVKRRSEMFFTCMKKGTLHAFVIVFSFFHLAESSSAETFPMNITLNMCFYYMCSSKWQDSLHPFLFPFSGNNQQNCSYEIVSSSPGLLQRRPQPFINYSTLTAAKNINKSRGVLAQKSGVT